MSIKIFLFMKDLRPLSFFLRHATNAALRGIRLDADGRF